MSRQRRKATAAVIGVVMTLGTLLAGCGGSHLSSQDRLALVADFAGQYPDIEALVTEGRHTDPLPATSAELAKQLTGLPSDARDAAWIQYWSALFAVASNTPHERSEAGYTLGFITEALFEGVCKHASDDAFATLFGALHDRSPALTRGAPGRDPDANTSGEGEVEIMGALAVAMRPGGPAVHHLSGSSARLESATTVIDDLYDIIAQDTKSPVGPQFTAGRAAAKKALA